MSDTAGTVVETGQDGFELFAKVLVHPGVEEGIVAGRADGYHVGKEEDEDKVVPAGDGLREVIVEDVDQVERQPATAKDDDHGHQHAVGPLLPHDGSGFTTSLTAGQP